eukprot:7598094-Heterocapsa_arctica.AAC.1
MASEMDKMKESKKISRRYGRGGPKSAGAQQGVRRPGQIGHDEPGRKSYAEHARRTAPIRSDIQHHGQPQDTAGPRRTGANLPGTVGTGKRKNNEGGTGHPNNGRRHGPHNERCGTNELCGQQHDGGDPADEPSKAHGLDCEQDLWAWKVNGQPVSGAWQGEFGAYSAKQLYRECIRQSQRQHQTKRAIL